MSGKTKTSDRIWIRIGDGDIYNDCGDDIGDVISALQSADVGRVDHWGQFDLYTTAYCDRCDYISIFWGDHDTQNPRSLTRAEKDNIQDHLGLVVC